MNLIRSIGICAAINGKNTDATRMKAHQSKKRCHAVPALPKELPKNENNTEN